MKRRHHPLALFIIFLLLPALLWAVTARGEECVLLQSSPLKPYEEARRGFAEAWMAQRPLAGPKSISLGTLTQLLLSEQPQENTDVLKKQLQNAQVVVAIGDPALDFVRELEQTSVVYILAPSAGELPANFTGIDMRIVPSRQLETISRLAPGLHAIGALYNPVQTGYWVQEALLSPGDAAQTLIFKKIAASSEVPGALHSLRHPIDCYWLLPDRLLTGPVSLQALREFSMNNRVPIISFADRYLKEGAAAAITFDMDDMGVQAAEMAARILGGTKPDRIPVESPRRQRVIANTRLFEKMGVEINEAVVDEVYPGGQQP